jgi:WD40 repeat protein
VTAPIARRAAAVIANPFRGLRPYEQDDRNALFGRDMDLTIMRERLVSSRTTLLFAASGVGKTSFIRAKLLPSFDSQLVWCYHRDWADLDPRRAIIENLSRTLGQTAPDFDKSLHEQLREFRRHPAGDSPQTLSLRPTPTRRREFLLVLDQFEEVFQYYGFHPEFPKFIAELTELINDETLACRVVISMRDDFLGQLYVFDNKIPDLFNNYYRLQPPTKSQAMEIIKQTAALTAPKVDASGLNALVADLSTFQRTVTDRPAVQDQAPPPSTWLARVAAWPIVRLIARSLRALFIFRKEKPSRTVPVERDFVIPPYLQIVCRELWDQLPSTDQPFLEAYGSTNTPRTATNRAATILREFCRNRLSGLKSERQRDLAARAFDFLMTREGAKMAYQLQRLAEHMDVKQAELEPVLDVLSEEKSRILRRFKGTDESWWYELYHDMYSPILYEWKREHQFKRNRWKRNTGWAVIGAAILILLWITGTAHDWTLIQDAAEDYPERSHLGLVQKVTLYGLVPFTRVVADEVWGRYWDRRAVQAELAEDRDRAVLLRVKALETRATEGRRRDVLRITGGEYGGDNLWTTLRLPEGVSHLTFSHDEKLLLATLNSGANQVWNLATLQQAATFRVGNWTLNNQRPSAVESASFVGDGRAVLTLNSSDRLELWPLAVDQSAPLATGCMDGVTAFVAASHGDTLFVGRPDGSIARLELTDLAKRPCMGVGAGGDFERLLGSSPLKARSRSLDIQSTVRKTGDLFPAFQLALSPDERRVLAASRMGAVYSWDAAAPSTPTILVRGLESVALSPDGARIAAVSVGQSGRRDFQLYDDKGRAVGARQSILSPLPVGPQFAADGTVVMVTAPFSEILLFDTATGRQTGSVPRKVARAGASTVIAPNGQLIAGNSSDGVIWMVRPDGQALLDPVLRAGATTTTFSPSGRYLATASASGVVRFWLIDPAARVLKAYERGGATVLSDDGQCVAYTGQNELYVENLATTGSMITLTTDAIPDQLVVSEGCRTIAGASVDGTVRIWNSATGAMVTEPARDDKQPASPFTFPEMPRLILSPDGSRLLVLGGRFDSIQISLFDTEGARISQSSAPLRRADLTSFVNTVQPAVFTRDSRWFVTMLDKLRVYSRSSVAPVVEFEVGAEFLSADVSEQMVAVGTAKGAYLLTLSGTPALTPLRENQNARVPYIRFSSDSSSLAAIENGVLRLYDPQTRRVLQTFSNYDYTAARFSPNRHWILATSADDVVHLLDAELGTRVGQPIALRPAGQKANEDGAHVVALEFASDSKTAIIATAGWVHRVELTETGMKALNSRQLSGTLVEQTPVRLLDGVGSKMAAVATVGAVATRLEVIDFNERASGRPAVRFKLSEWEEKLGLRLDGGDILARTPVPR